jgi:sugar/nucleoside kinase (ribokinase family)
MASARRPAFCIAGELLWDLHADGPLDSASRFTRVPGGAAANVAFGLRALGAEVAVAGVVGRDRFGAGLRAALGARGVDTSAVVARAGQTGSVFIEPLSGEGQRFFSYRPTVTWPARPALPAAWRRGSLRGTWLHVAAVDPDTAAPLAILAARARARGASLCVDLNARPRAWRGKRPGAAFRALVAQADVVKASEGDLRVLGLSSLAVPGALVLTRGARRVTVTHAERTLQVTPPRIAAVRAIGAGDAFVTRLLLELHAAAPNDARAWRAVVTTACAHAASHVA